MSLALRERPVARTFAVSPVVLAAFCAAAVPFALHVWAALHGGFDQDDFVITAHAAHANPFDPAYLFQDHQGHLAPGGFLLAWVATAAAPLDFPVLMAPLLLMHAAALVLFWATLVRCFGRRWGILVPFAGFAASPLLLVPTLWWAFGVQLVPVLLAAAGALHAHVRYLREGGRWAIGPVAWTAFGLLFYEKAVLIPVLLLGVTVLLGERVRGRAVFWICHLLLLAGYAVAFFARTSSQVGHGPIPVSAARIAELAGRMLGDTLLPGLFGGPWAGPGNGATWAASPWAVRIVLVAAAVTVLVTGVRIGGRRACQAWALLGLAVLVDVGLLAATRLTDVGPSVGEDPRYVAELALVAALCGAFAFLTPGAAPAERPVALVLAAALVVSAVTGFAQLAPGLSFAHSRQFVADVRAAVAADPGLVLYDAPVPSDIVHEWFGVDAQASRVVGLIPGTRFDQPAARMSLLDSEGRPSRITDIAPVARARPGPVRGCGTPVGEQLVRIPLDAPVFGRYLARVDYYTSAGGEGRVGGTPVWFQTGLHSVYLPLTGLYGDLGFQLSGPGAPVCIAGVVVGRPVTGP